MAKKILIVDDDLYIRDLYVEILKDEGYEIDTATNGEEGLKKIQAHDFDLVLLDVMMPKLDGIGLLKKLHDQNDPKKEYRIVLLTNLAHDPVIKEGVSNGAKAYLIKTDMTPDQLAAKVKEFIK